MANWKGGVTHPKCKDCQRAISYGSFRCKKCSLSHRPKGYHNKDLIGEKNPMWKGKKVGYRAIHHWVQRWLGKANKCMKNKSHKSTRYHWANISKQYKRDFSDWMQLCPSCNVSDRIGRRVSP